MILSFKTKFDWGAPTNFVQKIKDGIKDQTIRPDEHEQWAKGMLIHLATGARTHAYTQFGWGVVIDVKKITINPEFATINVEDSLQIDTFFELKQFAIKDGFSGFAEFFKYFGQDLYQGRLIKFKYLGDMGMSKRDAITQAKLITHGMEQTTLF